MIHNLIFVSYMLRTYKQDMSVERKRSFTYPRRREKVEEGERDLADIGCETRLTDAGITDPCFTNMVTRLPL